MTFKICSFHLYDMTTFLSPQRFFFALILKVSSNSSIESHTLRLHVQPVRLLPFRPSALYRWALKHHGNLSSLTHTTHGNRVYVRLGEGEQPRNHCHQFFEYKLYKSSTALICIILKYLFFYSSHLISILIEK